MLTRYLFFIESVDEGLANHYEARITELEILVRKLELHNKVLKKELATLRKVEDDKIDKIEKSQKRENSPPTNTELCISIAADI